MLSEISQKEKDKYLWSNLYVKSKKETTKKPKHGTHRYREQICSCQGRGLGVDKMGEGGQKV